MEQRWRGRFPVTLKQCISAHQPCVSERAAPAAPAARSYMLTLYYRDHVSIVGKIKENLAFQNMLFTKSLL